MYDQPSLNAIITHLAGAHFDGYANLNGVNIHIGEQGGNQDDDSSMAQT